MNHLANHRQSSNLRAWRPNNRIINQSLRRNSANIMWSWCFRHESPLGRKATRISESIELRWSVNCYLSSAAASEVFLLLSTATPPSFSTSTREIHNYGLIDATKALVVRLISQFWRKCRSDSPFRSLRRSFCSCRWLRTVVRCAVSRCFLCPMASPGRKKSERIIKFEFPIPGLSHQMKIYSSRLTPDAAWVTEHRQSSSNGH